MKLLSERRTRHGYRGDRNLALYLPRLAWPFSSASKPIDLGLGFQVNWVHMQLGFPASTLVGTLNG
jgi:hypothetical protein